MSDLSLSIPNGLITTVSAEDVAAVTKVGDFLPRIQIMGSGTEIVKEGKISQGIFALIKGKEDIQELGKEFDFLSVSWRPKALRITGDNVLNYYKRVSPEFQKIIDESASGGFNGCMYGPEFLVWLPSIQEFASFFFGNQTMRRESKSLLTLMDKGSNTFGPAPATARTHFIKSAKYSWWGLRVLPHSAPLPTPENPEEWSVELKEVMEKFSNPKESTVEKAEPVATERAR